MTLFIFTTYDLGLSFGKTSPRKQLLRLKFLEDKPKKTMTLALGEDKKPKLQQFQIREVFVGFDVLHFLKFTYCSVL